MIKVINKATGEVIEYDYKSWDDLADQYDDITQQIKALERAKVKMADAIKMEMGDDNKIELSKGRYFRKFQSEYKNYSVKAVLEAFDNFNYFKVDKKMVDEAIVESPDALWAKNLRDTMYTERVTESMRLIKDVS